MFIQYDSPDLRSHKEVNQYDLPNGHGHGYGQALEGNGFGPEDAYGSGLHYLYCSHYGNGKSQWVIKDLY